MLKEKGETSAGQRYRTDADGPRLLAVDERVCCRWACRSA
jgi:cytochrome c oxidase subunit 2